MAGKDSVEREHSGKGQREETGWVDTLKVVQGEGTHAPRPQGKAACVCLVCSGFSRAVCIALGKNVGGNSQEAEEGGRNEPFLGLARL